MNYKLMAEILLDKDNEGLSASVLGVLQLSECEMLIANIEDKEFLLRIKAALEKTTKCPQESEKIIMIIERRIEGIKNNTGECLQ
jgi:hypothetical protein